MSGGARRTAERFVDHPVAHVATTPSGSVLSMTGGTALDVASPMLAPQRTFDVGTSGVHVHALSASDEHVALASATGLELWTLDGRLLAEVDADAPAGGRAALAFTADGRSLVWARRAPAAPRLEVRVLDARTLELRSLTEVAGHGAYDCSAFPIGPGGILLGGWEGDGEHMEVVARLDAATGELTPVDELVGMSVLGATPQARFALAVPHGDGALWRMNLTTREGREWVSPREPPVQHEGFHEADQLAMLDERLAVVALEVEDVLLALDPAADDGAVRRVPLDAPRGEPRFLRRLGPRAFLIADVRPAGTRFARREL